MEKQTQKTPVSPHRHHPHDGHDDHDHEHSHSDTSSNGLKKNWDLLSGLFILVVLLILTYAFSISFARIVLLPMSLIAYLLAGHKVLTLAFRKARRGDFFNEFVLMSIATIGAFIIGSYEEGVAVMVFYQIGEWFQNAAVNKAKRDIKALLDIRPDKVTVIRNGKMEVTTPDKVVPGAIIQVMAGEKVALDGELLSEQASFNTAALTGESKPDTKCNGDLVFAGMINLNTVAEIKVIAAFKDSKLSRILALVQDATSRKSQTQLFISRFARIYTPIVFFLALAVCFAPLIFVEHYEFYTWFYRALVFLVISCPCALVVSIPLGYFGGIGLASRNGILFKGGNFLDVMTQVNTVVMDKTGTLTKGVFRVQKVFSAEIEEKEFIRIAATLESRTNHPAGKAIVDYAGVQKELDHASHVEEIAGLGLKGNVDGKTVLAGNTKLLRKFNIEYPSNLSDVADTIVVVAIDGQFSGYFIIADELKDDSVRAIEELHRLNIRSVILSGDKQSVVDKVKAQLNVDEAYGDLLPEDKVERLRIIKNEGKRIAFAGDGVNDAPVVALADAGIAMGGLGSDATIEIADIVIQNDQPTKIVSAIRIGKITRNIVWQNITLAMTVKIFVLVLGAGGVANLWEAVIADVGVALLAILNAVRIQSMKV